MLPEKPAAVLPQSARAIALLLAATPSVMDAPPRVLQMLMEFAHRYTAQVLSDALIFAEHAGRPGRLTTDDVTLAIQGKVGFEFGGRVPKEVSSCFSYRFFLGSAPRLIISQYILSLAAATNEEPLPPVQEAFGIRLPPPEQCFVAPDFELIPNIPPEEDPLYEEIEEEVTDEEEEVGQDEDEDEDEEMQDGDVAVNGAKPQENGMDVEEREGSDLFDGDEDEGDVKEPRRVADDDDYD
jgi:transcription initiation factor TFIID subunit 9B